MHTAAAMGEVNSAEDGSLVEAWRDGDRSAGDLLVERHFLSVYRFFRSKVAGEVDDLVQQTFMACLEAAPSFRGECSFRTLLFRIARRRLYDHFRARQRVSVLDFTTTSVRALGTSPSAALQRHDAANRVRAALQELPVDDQLLLELRYWEELTIEELARVFDVPQGTIKSRHARARMRLQRVLRAQGLSETEAQELTAASDTRPR